MEKSQNQKILDAKAKDYKAMRQRFRFTFLSTTLGKETLWYFLVYHCGIFTKCTTEEARIRHNMGIEILELCGMLSHGYLPQNLYVDIAKMRPKKRSILKRLCRKNA